MSEVQILVVDDEPELLEDLKSVAAKSTGGQIATAKSAAEACRLIEEKDFDLIITDLRMETPEAGLEVIEVARKKDLWTQVILVTAYGLTDEEIDKSVDTIARGAYDYVSRTVPGNYLKRVRELIPKALERQRHKQKEEADGKVGIC